MELLMNKTKISAEPVLPLQRLGVMFWMLIWETVICDMLIRALTPSSRATAAMVDELFFESFSFNALVGSLRVWVTKSSHQISVRTLWIILTSS
jgi:hypothetical protein